MNDDKQKSKNEIDSIFEPLKLFNDAPLSKAEHDALNFKDYADVIYESILGTDTPCTIGIFGEWGMGKTSMMNMTRDNIKKDNSRDYISVWFNAWQYENEEHTIVPLIATIIKEIKKQIKELEKEPLTYETEEKVKMLEKVEKKVSWLHKVNNALRSVASGISIEASGNVPLVGEAKLTFNGKDMVSRYEELIKDAFLEKSLYFDAYEKMEELSSTNLDEKIVIFIDDLDRCLPDKAVKLLENIKLFLSQRGFVFVLGVAREVVESYLEKRYVKDFGASAKHARKYLDKIVQIPILIPTHSSNLDSLSEKMFEKLGDKLDPDLKDILSIISKESDGNPRSLTRLINRIKINSRISGKINKKSKIKEDERIYYFAIACSLQEYFSDIYEDLINRESVRNICLNKKVDDDVKEIRHDGLSKHLTKENSVLKDFFTNKYVKIWLDKDDIREETVNFIQNNDSSFIDKDTPDYWKEENNKAKNNSNKKDLKKFIEITDKGYDFSKYLVTNSWYEEFIEDGGYKSDKFWETPESKKYLEDLKKDRDINSYRDLYDKDEKEFLHKEQPIVNVSYFDAKAFCKWLSEKSKQDGEYYTFDLPTNEEFGYVATKGEIKNIYPWGEKWDNKKCNNEDTNINTTSVVGLFPDGNSPFGICDMSGNVWKWTSSDYKNTSIKIIKGGSWDDSNGEDFSASDETFYGPDICNNLIGFFLTRTK